MCLQLNWNSFGSGSAVVMGHAVIPQLLGHQVFPPRLLCCGHAAVLSCHAAALSAPQLSCACSVAVLSDTLSRAAGWCLPICLARHAA